ncbi:hypothetical protein J2Z83_001879 [Virgibacillus natechei]|uniref:DUF4269 domain-containing protein n=2 Tax=Virgibacillus natechei TaxID=1216297 RepID=A0ABS4IHH8_9BACI|nr:hypothetical protein [Virgibacillus natechei]
MLSDEEGAKLIHLFEGLQMGNEKQQKAYLAIKELNICNDLSTYNPVLCGTLPIGIDVLGSDLDIVMEVQDLDYFEERVLGLKGLIVALFVINNKLIQGLPSSIIIISLLAYLVGCALEYYFKIHGVRNKLHNLPQAGA